MAINPYESQEMNQTLDTTYAYIIFRNDPDTDSYGQYIFEPNNLQNQFPGRNIADTDLDLYTHTPNQFFFLPYEYQIRRDITLEKNRKLYISNIAMGISNHKYARTNWTLSYYDSQMEYSGYSFDDMYSTYGSSINSETPLTYRNERFNPLNNTLYVPPMHKDGRTKAEFCEETSAYGYIQHMHHYSDRKTSSGSERWSGTWTIGNYNPDNESSGTNNSTTLMSPANTSMQGKMRNSSGSDWNSRLGAPLNIRGGDNDYLWRYTQILPLETSCKASGDSPYSGNNIEPLLSYDEDSETTYGVTGLEAAGIQDLFSKRYSTDNPSLSGKWYVCVHQEADGWEWKIVNWNPGWHAVNRDHRFECFIVPKQHYVNYWFYLVDSFNLGRAGGSSNSPIDYSYEDRKYIKHYSKALTYTGTAGAWNSMTSLDTYMAVGSIPTTLQDVRRIGAYSKYHSDFMGWINPVAPHQTVNQNQPFRFYNPFKKDATGQMYELLDLTGVTKPDGTPFMMQTHVNAIQTQFRPIIETTTSNGIIEFQRWYEEGVDTGFQLVSSPAEVEFNFSIKSNQSFFPSEDFLIDNNSLTLEEMETELGITYKSFVVAWGDEAPQPGDNSDGNMDGFGAGDSNTMDWPKSVTEYNQQSNQGKFIVSNRVDTMKHTYFEEGIYVITAYVMCIKERENVDAYGNTIIEDMVLAMKKTETKVRIEKEFIFYPDYLHLGEGDFPIIPWTSGVAPIIGGIAEKSDYKDSLRKVLGASSILFSNARENFLKGKTRQAYHNDELGSFLTKIDISQIRYYKRPFDINYLLGLRQTTYQSKNLRIEVGNCNYTDEISGENSVHNDRIYGDIDAITFMSSINEGEKLDITGFKYVQTNSSTIYSDYTPDGLGILPIISRRYFIVDSVNIDDNNLPFISIRGCEVMSQNLGDGEFLPSGNGRKIIIEPSNIFKTNIKRELIFIPNIYVCTNFPGGEYDYECSADNLGLTCGPTHAPGAGGRGVCQQASEEYFSWISYTDTEFWNGDNIQNSFLQESPINSIFINDTDYKILKDSCIIEYNFADNDGITVRDSSGNENNGIIVGDYGLLKVAENVPMGLGSSIKKPRVDEKNDGVL